MKNTTEEHRETIRREVAETMQKWSDAGEETAKKIVIDNLVNELASARHLAEYFQKILKTFTDLPF